MVLALNFIFVESKYFDRSFFIQASTKAMISEKKNIDLKRIISSNLNVLNKIE